MRLRAAGPDGERRPAIRPVAERVLAQISGLPSVDQHCHSLLVGWRSLDAAQPDWRRCFTEAQRPASFAVDVPRSAGYREFLRALRAFQGATAAEPMALEAAVVRRRDAAISAEGDGYVRRLFDDAGIGVLLVDTGYGGAGSLAPEALADLLGRPVRTIVRIESVAQEVLAAAGSRPMTRLAFSDKVLERLGAALVAGAVGFKSIAAYRSGLDLPEPTAPRLASAFRGLDRAAQARRLDDPVIVAHVVWIAARLASARGAPLQFHVGFGDEDVHLPTADPTLLRPLFRDPTTEGCPVVLLHCYPFIEEAAYLASVYPQVSVDLSLTIPLLGGAAAEQAIATALALCPTQKLLAASDGHAYPEMHWRGLRLWREALGRVLAAEVEAGRLDEAEAQPIARAILAGNSERLYRLSSSG